MSGFDQRRIARLRAAIEAHTDSGRVGGAAWLASCGQDVEVGVAGTLTRGEPGLVQRDSIFRIASMTKPVTAIAALILIEECKLRLEDPVDDLLPELADRRVLVDGRGPLDGATMPARRPIVIRDLLTFELGYGMNFDEPWPQPLLEAMGELGLGDGPPQPQGPPGPDEWLRRLSTLPLLFQPGERWLYNVGADVLGVAIARASGQPFDAFLRERVFEPLGMIDTGFATPSIERLGSCYAKDLETGAPVLYDAPNGQFAKSPAFPSGAGGLVSTIDDIHAFARMLLDGGSPLVSRAAVEAMTTDQIDVGRGNPGPSLDGSQGWGFGVGVTVRRVGLASSVGTYGWAGGLGSSWANDPREDIIGVILTTDMFTGPFPPPQVIQDFWTGVYAAVK